MTVEQSEVDSLHDGDVIELRDDRWPGDSVVRGPVVLSDYGFVVGPMLVTTGLESLRMTVVARAPRPLYVNHPRTEPVPKDVVLDGEGVVRYVAHTATGLAYWSHDYEPRWGWTHHSNPPKPLRLLVDGETGMAVTPDAAEVWDEGFEAGHHWWNVGMSGIPHDPPRNPYETGQVVP